MTRVELELELELEHLHCRCWRNKMEGHLSLHQAGFLAQFTVLLSISITVLCMDGWMDVLIPFSKRVL